VGAGRGGGRREEGRSITSWAGLGLALVLLFRHCLAWFGSTGDLSQSDWIDRMMNVSLQMGKGCLDEEVWLGHLILISTVPGSENQGLRLAREIYLWLDVKARTQATGVGG
jgi:hypothetical protein